MSRNVAADGRSARVVLSVVRGRCAVGCEIMPAREMPMLREDAAHDIGRIDSFAGIHSNRVLPDRRKLIFRYRVWKRNDSSLPVHWMKCPRYGLSSIWKLILDESESHTLNLNVSQYVSCLGC